MTVGKITAAAADDQNDAGEQAQESFGPLRLS